MKKNFTPFLGIAMLCFSFAACSNDDDSTSGQNEKLTGKWIYVQELALDANGKVVSTYNDDNGKCPLDLYDFLSNGTVNQMDYNYSTLESNCKAENVSGKWSIKGNQFTLENKYSGNVDVNSTYKINKLTGDTFEIDEPLPRNLADDYELNVVTLRQVFKKN